MARKSKETADIGTKPDLLSMEALQASAVKTFGADNIKSWDEFTSSVYGVPIVNNLPLQYLLGVDCLPLGRLISVVGSWGTSKSSFCWYLGSLFARYGGLVPFIDAEFKSNPAQIRSILQSQLTRSPQEYFLYQKARTIDTILHGMLFWSEQLKVAGGREKGVPLLLVVDSIGTVTTQKAVDKRLENGETPGFTAAHTANSIKEGLQVFSPRMEDLPMLCLLVNHQKTKLDTSGGGGRPSYGPPPTTEGGGTHKDFQYSMTIQINKGLKEKTLSGGITPHVLFTMKKSSLGREPLRPIEVPYRSTKRITEKGFDEDIWYDWDHALALMLTDEKLFPKAAVNDIIDIKADGKKFSCKSLGLSGVSAHEVGALIHADKRLVERLQNELLCIRRIEQYGTIVAGTDFINCALAAGDEGTGEGEMGVEGDEEEEE
jgi:hypothetical protein